MDWEDFEAVIHTIRDSSLFITSLCRNFAANNCSLIISTTMKYFLLFLVALLSFPLSAGERIKVACVGNSVTFGYKLPDRATQSYPVRLQELLGKDYEVRNFGHSGATLLRHGHRPYMSLPEFREAIGFKADRVVIHLGLNDTDPRNWPDYQDEFIADYTALIDSFVTANPKAKIWICLMTPIFHDHPRFDSGTLLWHGQIQDKIRRIAETNPHVTGLIDLYSPLHAYPHLFPDALHPDPEGAQILARTVYEGMTGDFGELTLPVYYGNNMVMQRHQPLKISGIAPAGEKVRVKFLDKTRTAVTDAGGHWAVSYASQPSGGPYRLTVESKSGRREIDSIWIGEVWLCSGQSNMEFRLNQSATAKADIAEAGNQPLLHLYNMKSIAPTDARQWDEATLREVNHLRYIRPAEWKVCSSEAAADFSAIAYHFGRVLADSLGLHVGLICNAVGGSATESWIDRSTLEYAFPSILRNWDNNDFVMPWVRSRARQNTGNRPASKQRHPYQSAYLFESAMQPLEGLKLKGVLWYQGESNAHNVEAHERLFPLLEDSWRSFFGQPDLPFYFVQLSSLNRPSWPLFRDSQRRLAETLDDTYMVVTTDLGDSLDVHPRRKRPVGRRLALSALRHTYGFDGLVPSGPQFRRAAVRADEMLVSFKYGRGLKAADGGEIIGFELAGADGIYRPATARVVKDNGFTGLAVRSAELSGAPVAVRYGWQPFTRANLVNGAGLPASTFKCEEPAMLSGE